MCTYDLNVCSLYTKLDDYYVQYYQEDQGVTAEQDVSQVHSSRDYYRQKLGAFLGCFWKSYKLLSWIL